MIFYGQCRFIAKQWLSLCANADLWLTQVYCNFGYSNVTQWKATIQVYARQPRKRIAMTLSKASYYCCCKKRSNGCCCYCWFKGSSKLISIQWIKLNYDNSSLIVCVKQNSLTICLAFQYMFIVVNHWCLLLLIIGHTAVKCNN